MTFQTLQTEEFLEKFANLYMSVIVESLCKKYVTYILNELFVNVLTDSFLLLTNILFKMLEVLIPCVTKRNHMWKYNLLFFCCKFLSIFFGFGDALRKELLYERRPTVADRNFFLDKRKSHQKVNWYVSKNAQKNKNFIIRASLVNLS